LALVMLEEALPLLGAGSEPGKDVLQTIGRLAKHVPPGAVTPADVASQLRDLMVKQQQQSQQMQQMRAGQQPQPGQPGQQNPGPQPQPMPPMPPMRAA
jgi:hypothetical protein